MCNRHIPRYEQQQTKSTKGPTEGKPPHDSCFSKKGSVLTSKTHYLGENEGPAGKRIRRAMGGSGRSRTPWRRLVAICAATATAVACFIFRRRSSLTAVSRALNT